MTPDNCSMSGESWREPNCLRSTGNGKCGLRECGGSGGDGMRANIGDIAI